MAPRGRDSTPPANPNAETLRRRSAAASSGADGDGGTKAKREFGDHMALEGETSNIAHVMLLYYLAVFLLSVFARKVCGAGWWTIPLYYAAGMFAFYVWHLMAHSKWTGRMNDIHMRHHVYTYPPSAFYGRTATTIREELGKDCPTLMDLLLPNKTITMQLAHEGPLYLFMGIILAAGRWIAGSSLSTLGVVLLSYMAMGLIGNAMHMSFHVKGFELERYAWYRELRALHYLHHLGDMKSNLAMVNLGMDGAMGSLATSVDSLRQPARTQAKLQKSHSGLPELMAAADLPDGMTPELLDSARGSAGLIAATFGFDLPLDIAKGSHKLRVPALKRGLTTVVLRLVIVLLCASAWYQAVGTAADSGRFLVEQRPLGEGAAAASAAPAVDHGQAWMVQHVAPVLLGDPTIAACACRLSDAVTNLTLVLVVVSSITGTTFRPFLAVIISSAVRHAIQMLGPVPATSSSTWVAPAEGSEWWAETLMAASDPTAFFSVRVCMSVIALTELLRLVAPDARHALDAPRRVLGRGGGFAPAVAALGYLNVLFQIALALGTRASFTFDVIVAFVVGRYSTLFASMYCSSFLDAFMP
mmetsp:Transcript_44040/g.137974  ORF Transcript_44040/g.137974 Transcript_44040/m.137974 type:complete len:586 (-) Transcript_44040:74-1831(-)